MRLISSVVLLDTLLDYNKYYKEKEDSRYKALFVLLDTIWNDHR